MYQRTNNSGAVRPFRHDAGRHRAPFWVPASGYYVVAFLWAVFLFVLIVGVLHDGIDDLPWIIAGVASALVLAAAFVVREVILRNARERFLSAKQIDKSVRQIAQRNSENREPAKLTLERNETILSEIRKKSEAAKVLGKFAEAHKEVCDLCEEYLTVAANELSRARSGSPRIPAMRKGSGLASDRHRYHMLQWAEIESRTLTNAAKTRSSVNEKLDTAQKALGVLDHALRSYPDEPSLVDSQLVLKEFLTSIRVSDSIEKAEKAFFKGDHKRAVGFYQDALFDLKRFGIRGAEGDKLAAQISTQIDRIGKL